MKKGKTKVGLEKWIVVGLVLLSLGAVSDPDLGWHLRIGEWIRSEQSVPQTEQWSFGFGGHEYINHSWLFDVILARGHTWMGMWGVNLVYGLLILAGGWLVYLIAKELVKDKSWAGMVVGFMPIVVAFLGWRSQWVSFVGVSFLLWWLIREKEGHSIKEWYLVNKTYWVVIVFGLWANMHGGFLVGFLVWLGWLSGRLIEGKASLKWFERHMGLILMALMATLMNPYGGEIYRFLFRLIEGGMGSRLNSDWVSLISARLPSESLWLRVGLLAGSVYLGLFTKINIKWKWLILSLLGLSLWSMRFVIGLLAVVIPIAAVEVERVAKKHRLRGEAVGLGIVTIVLGLALINGRQMVCANLSENCFSQLGGFPKGAVEYLKKNEAPERIFNHYTWGGYLMWQLPEKSFWIDGRMDHYEIDGRTALEEFWGIEQMKPGWEERLEATGSQAVLLPANWKLNEALMERNWQRVYQDNTAIILVR